MVSVAATIALWYWRLAHVHNWSGPPDILLIGIDAGLVAVQVWALLVLQRLFGPGFGSRRRMSWHLYTPALLALFFLVRDYAFWFLARPL